MYQASESNHGNSWKFPTAVVLATAVLIAVGPRPARSQAVELVVVDVAAVAKGYRTSKLMGSNVVNDRDERIGTIDDIIIGRDRVLLLQVGGFLGLGGHLVAVPYQGLVLDDTGDKIVLPGATQDELKKLAEFKYGS
jgi:PRC-barrel domain